MSLLDEKPKTHHAGAYGIMTKVYAAGVMNKWLEKIEPYVDLAEQIIETFNEDLPHEEVIAGYKVRDHLRKTYEMITELARKAETLDKIIELRYWTRENEPTLDNIIEMMEKAEKYDKINWKAIKATLDEKIEAEDKLEAVRNHNEKFPTYGLNLVDTYEKFNQKASEWFLKLLKILGDGE